MKNHQKFLILGCQRSGTTLLGMALEAHKNIELIEENNPNFHSLYALTQLINLKTVTDYKPKNHIMAGFKAPRDSHRTVEIAKKIPGIKMAWVSRDVHQVVASMVTLIMNNNVPWALMFAPSEIIKYLYTYTEDYAIARSYQQATNITDARSASIAMATLCWLTKKRCEEHSCTARPNDTISIDYDKLVTTPKETLTSLLEFLNLSYEASVLTHAKLVTGERPGGSSPNRKIDTTSINKWKNVLSNKETKMIESIIDQVNSETP